MSADRRRVRYVAFVRAVMIGREGLHRQVLEEIVAAAGAEAPRSHLATGNVSFTADPESLGPLVEEVRRSVSEVVGRDIEVFVRSIAHVRSILTRDPFQKAPAWTRDRLVTFFHDAPELPWRLPVEMKGGLFTILAVDGPDVFSITREVDGRTAAPGGMFERVAGKSATTRAWSTIEHVVRMHA